MFEKIKSFFNREDKSSKPKHERRFIGAKRTRWTDWIDATLTKINLDTDMDLLSTITKCRDLAKNSPVIRAYLSSCVKNIVRQNWFRSSVPSQEQQ